jgi:hypothetical protein
MAVALGFWASGVAGALFVLPQILSLGTLQITQASRLLPFAALIGLLAGLTLEKVFPKLIKVEVPVDTRALEPEKAQANTAPQQRRVH